MVYNLNLLFESWLELIIYTNMMCVYFIYTNKIYQHFKNPWRYK